MFNHFLTDKIALPLFDRAKGLKIRRYHNLYRKTLNWNRDEIEKFQLEKLKKLLIHAGRNSPFYARRFKESGFDPASVAHIEALKEIPPLTRTDVQSHFDDLLARNIDAKNAVRGSSSGSTGQPVHYYHDSGAQSAGQAAGYIGWGMAGWKLGERGLHIWGNPTIVREEWTRLSSKLKVKLFNHHKFPAYKLTEGENYDELLRVLQKKRYSFIDGYTNAIYLFAKYVKEQGIAVTKLNQVFTTAENLHDYQRNLIEEVLGPVYDSYGCGEIWGIAYECGLCRKYHIMDPHVIVEFDESHKTDDGSLALLLTDLDNFIMPLIRYRNGDLARPDPGNQCRFKFSSLSAISGRLSDIIDLPGGGNLVVPSFFGSMLLKQLNNLTQYQIERISKSKIVIKLRVTGDLSVSDKVKLTDALQEYLKGKIEWELKIVDRIPVSSNGKFKLLVDRTK